MEETTSVATLWEVMIKSGRLKFRLLRMTPFFSPSSNLSLSSLPLPYTCQDPRLSICCSCPFLHGRLQGLRGLCSKWSQTGLGFAAAYRQREIQGAWEVRNHTCSHHCTHFLFDTHRLIWLPDSFRLAPRVRVRACERTPHLQYTANNISGIRTSGMQSDSRFWCQSCLIPPASAQACSS